MNNQSPNPDDQTKCHAISDPDEIKLREISDESLEIILTKHQKWLETNGAEGARADLSECDLRSTVLAKHPLLARADLTGSNLEGAYLLEANLEEARLVMANLQNAYLESASLKGANLFEADITNAYLERADLRGVNMWGIEGIRTAYLDDCNMEGATGLQGDEFTGANVRGARLPADIAKWHMLEVVAETSKNARKIFLAMLLGCVYCWLTIASTTDADLLTNSASSPLPIIGTEIPIAWFYLAAPLILVGLYCYQHFYLHRLWEGLAGLPAIFEDGKRLDQRAYPWLLNGLVRRHFDKLRQQRTPFQRLEEWVTIFLAWWIVPLTLLGFWVRYLPRHDWVGTGLQVGLAAAAVAAGFAFYTAHARTIRAEERSRLTWKSAWKDSRIWRTIGSLGFCTGLIALSYGSINGVRSPVSGSPSDDGLCSRAPRFFAQFGYDVFADLHGAVVSTRPDNYWELDPRFRDSSVAGANLAGSDLRGANLEGAFLLNANLRSANLTDANMVATILTGAMMDSAKMDWVTMKDAKLQHASLVKSQLYNADLSSTDMVSVDLTDAFCCEANLICANLRLANLTGTDLSRAKLHGASLCQVKLVEAHLEDAVLDSTDFTHADMAYCDLTGANLHKADFRQVDLSKTHGLTSDEIKRATTNGTTILPDSLK